MKKPDDEGGCFGTDCCLTQPAETGEENFRGIIENIRDKSCQLLGVIDLMKKIPTVPGGIDLQTVGYALEAFASEILSDTGVLLDPAADEKGGRQVNNGIDCPG